MGSICGKPRDEGASKDAKYQGTAPRPRPAEPPENLDMSYSFLGDEDTRPYTQVANTPEATPKPRAKKKPTPMITYISKMQK